MFIYYMEIGFFIFCLLGVYAIIFTIISLFLKKPKAMILSLKWMLYVFAISIILALIYFGITYAINNYKDNANEKAYNDALKLCNDDIGCELDAFSKYKK